MNYYEKHIGDYLRDTAHLSLLEHGVYSRLMDVYYSSEKPLPGDIKTVERLVNARSKEEKKSVTSVLTEFFSLDDDGFHQRRCDQDISRFHEKSGKAKNSANARWAKERAEADTNKDDSERNAIASPPHMRSASERNAIASETHDERNAPQSPVPRHQTNTQPLPFPLVRESVERFAKTAARTNAAAFHAAMVGAMRAEGWAVTAEFPVPDRGDGRSGRIDAVVTAPAVVGLEFDRCSVRAKSVEKLSHIEGYRVVVLRDADSHPPMPGIDAVICCGKANGVAEGFADFYAKYPRKVARAEAEKAWSKIDPDEGLRGRIMAALLSNGFDYREDGRFIPHPATWLNQARWDDELLLEIGGHAEQVNRV